MQPGAEPVGTSPVGTGGILAQFGASKTQLLPSTTQLAAGVKVVSVPLAGGDHVRIDVTLQVTAIAVTGPTTLDVA